MSKYDIMNGKSTFRVTPLDYLHCIFNEYEWLMLLKGRNKPYEEILDPLYDIARKERYKDEELTDTIITISATSILTGILKRRTAFSIMSRIFSFCFLPSFIWFLCQELI